MGALTQENAACWKLQTKINILSAIRHKGNDAGATAGQTAGHGNEDTVFLESTETDGGYAADSDPETSSIKEQIEASQERLIA